MEDEWYYTGIIRSIVYALGTAICGTFAALHTTAWLFPGAMCVILCLVYLFTMLREIRRS